MLHITFQKAKSEGACLSGYLKLAKHLGGVTKYGKDTPIPLSTVLESNGLDDTIWGFRCIVEHSAISDPVLIEFACRCAEHTLPFFEDKYPDDKRPRQAIDAARLCITDKSDDALAARSAAWSAAGSAAGLAAWSAEKEWQKQTLLKLLEEVK